MRSGQPGINGNEYASLPVPKPPIHEQTAIATALSDVDALLDSLDRLIAKKRDIKQAAMQQLLTGETRLPGFEGEWEEANLGECLVSKPDYGINAPAVPFSNSLPTYIRITDITEFGRFIPDPPVSVNNPHADKYFLEEGDMVVARTGASVGKSYLYDSADGQLVFAGFLIRFRPDPRKLNACFLAAFLTTARYWNWVSFMSTRSGQPGVNSEEYSQLSVPLPSVEEQVAIATVLTDMDAEITALEQRRDKTRDLKQAMMQELLTGRTRLV
jgi:type I restriction enzyme S subunit